MRHCLSVCAVLALLVAFGSSLAGAGRLVSSVRPYSGQSAWNTPIGPSPALRADSSALVGAVADNNLPLTADPDQYTIPVYVFDASTPRTKVRINGYYSTYDRGDRSRVGHGENPVVTVPNPAGAQSGVGSDGQIVLWDPKTGTEYGFWQWRRSEDGTIEAENGYRYHTGPSYGGRFADGLAGRGGGMPYFAGLVRKWEIQQGHVDHALAFAYDSPSGEFVFPASKSDGGDFGGVKGADIPEGARLQLNPALTNADFARWGLNRTARILARAMQRYGMIVVDHSGSSKVYLEDRRTAKWGSDVKRSMLSRIPWNQFRVLAY